MKKLSDEVKVKKMHGKSPVGSSRAICSADLRGTGCRLQNVQEGCCVWFQRTFLNKGNGKGPIFTYLFNSLIHIHITHTRLIHTRIYDNIMEQNLFCIK